MRVARVGENVTLEEVNLSSKDLTLINEIPKQKIKRDNSIDLDMRKYFSGADRYVMNVENITAEFNGEIATLTPDSGFVGARRARIIAYSGSLSLVSNEFDILVSSGELIIAYSGSLSLVSNEFDILA